MANQSNKNYQINELGVATDPEIIIFHSDNNSFCEVCLASNGLEWAYGWHIQFKTHGNGCLPAFGKHNKLFSDREKALDAVILIIKDLLQSFIKEYGKPAVSFKENVMNKIEEIMQVELFT